MEKMHLTIHYFKNWMIIKNLKGIEYKLVEAKQIDSNIHLKIEVKNINRKNFNYLALNFS